MPFHSRAWFRPAVAEGANRGSLNGSLLVNTAGCFPLTRRGGACPSRHSVAGGPSFHTVGVGHWPARFLFSGQFRSTHPRPCTLCHGWSEPGAAVKRNRPKFCTVSGSGGPEEIKPRNRILRAGTFAEEYRDNPRKRGSGGGSAGAVRRPRDTPGGVLVPLPPRAKRLAPQGETLSVE